MSARGSRVPPVGPGRGDPAAEEGPSGPSTTVAVAACAVLILLIAGLVLFGRSWAADAVAIALTLGGVLALSRYLQILTPSGRAEAPTPGLGGMNEDMAVSDEAHAQLSVHDLPQENPAHRALEEQAAPATPRPPEAGERRPDVEPGRRDEHSYRA
jgi:hypothetical protein